METVNYDSCSGDLRFWLNVLDKSGFNEADFFYLSIEEKAVIATDDFIKYESITCDGEPVSRGSVLWYVRVVLEHRHQISNMQ